MTAEQMGDREGLNPAAAFLASCAAVTTVTENGDSTLGRMARCKSLSWWTPKHLARRSADWTAAHRPWGSPRSSSRGDT